jgi:hypothetical protein
MEGNGNRQSHLLNPTSQRYLRQSIANPENDQTIISAPASSINLGELAKRNGAKGKKIRRRASNLIPVRSEKQKNWNAGGNQAWFRLIFETINNSERHQQRNECFGSRNLQFNKEQWA